MTATVPGHSQPMTFGKAISTCLGKYAVISGRASRAEYWWFQLFYALMVFATLIIDQSMTLFGLLVLAMLLPVTGSAVRRLHDTNRSGWWLLFGMVPLAGILVIVWLASEGDQGANNYGNPP